MRREYFDALAPAYYDRNYVEPSNRHAYNLMLRREACLKLLPEGRGPVLDLGCGPGAMTMPLLDAGYDVISTDFSIGMVRTATARAAASHHTELAAAVADACALPLATGSIATVVTTGVLEYVPDLRKALAEIHRVLQPEGVAIATMSLPRRFERFVVGVLSKVRRQSTVPQFIYSRANFDRAIEESGFRIDVRESCCFAPFPLDAAWPNGVLLIDRHLGASLNHSRIACDQAKTYIVRAVRV
jgi:ubiquinone/menaquinone biosynthesis C-methylase UbiE